MKLPRLQPVLLRLVLRHQLVQVQLQQRQQHRQRLPQVQLLQQVIIFDIICFCTSHMRYIDVCNLYFC